MKYVLNATNNYDNITFKQFSIICLFSSEVISIILALRVYGNNLNF